MNRTSRIMGILAMFGFMVTSTQAAFEILNNPHGLDLQALTAAGVESWDWSSDTLEAAYTNGQLDVITPTYEVGGITYPAVVFGAVSNLVDGSGSDYTDSGMILYNQFTAAFVLNESYDGPRVLGTIDGQYGHAMRVISTYHESYNKYHFIIYYQTTDAPGVWKTLFEVQDLDTDPNWSATVVFVKTDAACQAIENINAIALKSFAVAQGNPPNTNAQFYGANFMELDVNLDGIAADKKSLFPSTPDMGWSGTTGTVDWTVGSYITVGNAPVSVSALGYVDHGEDGLADSHSVGIYDAGQVLLASATVAAGTANPLTNGWRYATLASPVELAANTTYLIVGDTGDGVDPFRYVPETDDDEPIPATGNGVWVPDLDGDGIGYGGTNAVGDLARVYATSGGDTLTYPTEVRDGVWNAVNMQYDILVAQATIVGWSITNDMMRLVLDAPGSPDGFYPKATTDLVSGTWTNVAHSDDGVNPFYITNLSYSTVEGANKVIYVDTTNSQSFFGIGE